MQMWQQVVAKFLFAQLLVRGALALPVETEQSQTVAATCENPVVRKEWRTLSTTERKGYIDAVKCLMAKPAITPKTLLPGVSNHFEDYLGTHILQMQNIHFVGIFFPWHRYYLSLWEQGLHECGYAGGQPYWDWTLDTTPGGLAKSPIFDPVTGFGGNGEYVPLNLSNPLPMFTPPPGQPGGGMPAFNPPPGFSFPPGFMPSAPGNGSMGGNGSMPFMPPFNHTGGGCIATGPFANLTVHLGPMWNVTYNPRCVKRDFGEEMFISSGNQSNIDRAMAQTTFGAMTLAAEWTVHNAGHGGVGGMLGDMIDAWSSPSDPVFYLHHGNLDRVWWSWQSRNLTARTTDISGPLLAMDYTGARGGNATLDTPMEYASLTKGIKVRDAMDIRTGNLCYTYDKLY